jgi:hypothetical protein
VQRRQLDHALRKAALLLAALLFSGEAAAGNAATPGTVIIDSNKAVVANLLGATDGVYLSKLFPGTYVDLGQFSVGTQGFHTDYYTLFQPGFLNAELFYMSSDCSGNSYMKADSIPVRGYVDDAATGVAESTPSASVVIYYPGPPYQMMNFNSQFDVGQPGSAPTCRSGAVTLYSGLAATEMLSVVPPLTLNTK